MIYIVFKTSRLDKKGAKHIPMGDLRKLLMIQARRLDKEGAKVRGFASLAIACCLPSLVCAI